MADAICFYELSYYQVWESHEVTEPVDDDTGDEVTGSDEEEGGKDSEDRRVSELHGRTIRNHHN